MHKLHSVHQDYCTQTIKIYFSRRTCRNSAAPRRMCYPDNLPVELGETSAYAGLLQIADVEAGTLPSSVHQSTRAQILILVLFFPHDFTSACRCGTLEVMVGRVLICQTAFATTNYYAVCAMSKRIRNIGDHENRLIWISDLLNFYSPLAVYLHLTGDSETFRPIVPPNRRFNSTLIFFKHIFFTGDRLSGVSSVVRM